MTIRTHYEPTLGRKLWIAWDDEMDEGDVPLGRGATEADAIADLALWIAELGEWEE